LLEPRLRTATQPDRPPRAEADAAGIALHPRGQARSESETYAIEFLAADYLAGIGLDETE